MRILEAYIGRQIGQVTGKALLVLVAAFVLERTLRLIRDLGPDGLALGQAASLLAFRLPEILGIVMPAALFVGVLVTFQRLVRDSELDIFYASGLGVVRLMRPVAVIVGLFVLAAALIFWILLPHSKYQFRALLHEVSESAATAVLKTGSFLQFGENVLYVHPQAKDNDAAGSVFFYEPNDDGERYVTTGSSGAVSISTERGQAVLSARDGRRLSLPGAGRKSTLMTFDQARLVVEFPRHGAFRERGADVTELTLDELLGAIQQTRETKRSAGLRAQFHNKLARVLAVLMLPFAAVTLALVVATERQWIAISIGAVLVLAVDQLLIYGETRVGLGGVSPWLGIWAPIAAIVFTFLVVLAFVRPIHAGSALGWVRRRPSRLADRDQDQRVP